MAELFKDKIVKILLDSGMVRKTQLDNAVSVQKKKGGNIGKILMDNGVITQNDLMLI